MRERRELGRLLTSRVDCDLPVYVQFVHILLVTLAARFRGLILLLLAERQAEKTFVQYPNWRSGREWIL